MTAVDCSHVSLLQTRCVNFCLPEPLIHFTCTSVATDDMPQHSLKAKLLTHSRFSQHVRQLWYIYFTSIGCPNPGVAIFVLALMRNVCQPNCLWRRDGCMLRLVAMLNITAPLPPRSPLLNMTGNAALGCLEFTWLHSLLHKEASL